MEHLDSTVHISYIYIRNTARYLHIRDVTERTARELGFERILRAEGHADGARSHKLRGEARCAGRTCGRASAISQEATAEKAGEGQAVLGSRLHAHVKVSWLSR